ncbi:Glutamate--cysteine ligase [Candidatus Arsenophonus lipoptenae]|uniref:Glutamate--cysteine ligase n=1 Tax=Candidatus Arsenophonus lipoptenae TaxID=634113 RepID=A0A0X9VSG7_9GAMM|nr:glutamate--cysteine ligase [Candidatus Arsenophonus lipoptenae]AMA64952.1 Glutamate--cysteine ligase [Candidatus Arsenophonus lipoptenae]
MIPNVSKNLFLLNSYPNIFNDIRRGIERETLRITQKGRLAQSQHPNSLGKALTHPWITTDFAESLLEFITPVNNNIRYDLAFLRDLYRYTIRNLDNELLWPLSIPCFIEHQDNIKLAKYGVSNIGRFKTLYREGLKNRYGAFMQTIAGIHYNFSLPIKFWQILIGIKDAESGKEKISAGYFRLIRNYYRFGWVIPYLFGASPAIYSSFVKDRSRKLNFEKTSTGIYYLPYATSLRMSAVGYNNKFQNHLKINLNNLKNYIGLIQQAIKKPSPEFVKLGIYNKYGQYLQLNTNILQIENEFYAPIRPKRVLIGNESSSYALLKRGIEYIEVRSLDINPFNAIGIDEIQILFLDLFLIWCVLADSPLMDEKELNCCRYNWNKVILEGRKPGQIIAINCGKLIKPLKDVGRILFDNLIKIVDMLEYIDKTRYEKIFSQLTIMFDNPDLTYSGKILSPMIEKGISYYGLQLSQYYYKQLNNESYEVINSTKFTNICHNSIYKQLEIEQRDKMSFDNYLKFYFK